MSSIGVVGLGAVGTRVARALVAAPGVERILLREPRRNMLRSLGATAHAWTDGEEVDVAVLCGPAGAHPSIAQEHLAAGRSVVSVSDDPRDVDALLALDDRARGQDATVVVGAAFSPGLSCLLARHAAGLVDQVVAVDVAMLGAGGPACVAQRRRLLAGDGREWEHGHWREVEGGTGDELVWFPDPIGPRDCTRGALPEPTLLARLFPDAEHLRARGALERVERWLPQWPGRGGGADEDDLGAIRVEVSGRRDDAVTSVVYAVMDRPALATGIVAALAAAEVGRGAPPGAYGVAEVLDVVPTLRELSRRGVRAATFEHR